MTTVGGAVLGQAAVLASAPLLARIYDPRAFGEYGVFAATIAVLSALVVLRLDVALLAASAMDEARHLAWAGIVIVVLGAVALSVVGMAVPTSSRPDGVSDEVILLAGFSVLVLGVAQLSNAWMVRNQRYTAIAARSALQGVLQTATQIISGLLGLRVGLLLGLGAGRLAAVGGLTATWGLLRGPRPTMTACIRTLSRFRRYPLVSSWSGLINSAGLQAPLLILASQYGAVGAGLLTLTSRVLAAPVALLGTATASVFQGELVRRKHTDPAALLTKTLRALLLVGLAPAVALVLLGPWAFTFAFGDSWRTAGVLAQVLAPAYLAQFAVVPVSQTLLIFQRNGTQLVWDTTRLALVTLAPLTIVAVGGSLVQAVAAISFGQTLAYAWLAWLSLSAARKTLPEADRTTKETP